ncbi:oxidoreductase [Ligilactobacillus agilis DSM 20509]|uniref:Oxidoreductase n=1 Tax=Ligilactobacillus agilis DSM 20509 TaxID=1423718 RepID=A0A0R2ADL9_9LACO|nr:oxidoreductase [Ligilactobacillus agilis DSM 20509]
MMQKLTSLTSDLKLSNGVTIPGLGYGTYQTPPEDAYRAVTDALAVGYRHIDTAALYGNESGVGQAVKDSGLKREEVFITSKLWNTERGYDKTMAAFEKTLAELGTDYLDLYLIHWPANEKQFGQEAAALNLDTWRAFEDLYKAGKIKAIGVSNFMPNHLEALLAQAEIKPMVNQIEVHPGWPQTEAIRYCQRNDILVEAWAPLGEAAALSNPVLAKIAAKYDHTPAQVCLRWEIQQGILPLPKSVHRERMAENTKLFDFELTEDEMDIIGALRNLGGNARCQIR